MYFWRGFDIKVQTDIIRSHNIVFDCTKVPVYLLFSSAFCQQVQVKNRAAKRHITIRKPRISRTNDRRSTVLEIAGQKNDNCEVCWDVHGIFVWKFEIWQCNTTQRSPNLPVFFLIAFCVCVCVYGSAEYSAVTL